VPQQSSHSRRVGDLAGLSLPQDFLFYLALRGGSFNF
jgi:hypothetical protein